MAVLHAYDDKARAFALYGALRGAIQTQLETDRSEELLAHDVTWVQVRSDAISHEGREKAHLADLNRKMQLLGVNTVPAGKQQQRANTRQLQGTGTRRSRGRGDRQGRKGKGNGRGSGAGRQDDDEDEADLGPPVAGRDGQILDWIRCYGCNRLGHVKKKDGQVNCPTWTGGSAAPAAGVRKIDPVPTAAGIDLDALFVATNAFDQGDDDSLAMIRQLYMKAAEDNAAVQRAVVGSAPSSSPIHGASPTGQTFLALVGWAGVNASGPELVLNDGGSPVNMISSTTATP